MLRYMKFAKSLLLIIPIVVMYLVGCFPISSDNAVIANNNRFGSLEMVTTPETIPSQIVNYEGMILSFNKNLHIPNWVAWELTATEVSGISLATIISVATITLLALPKNGITHIRVTIVGTWLLLAT